MSWTRRSAITMTTILSTTLSTTLVATVATTFMPRAASAQHAFGPADGRYDPAVPTPRAILGYPLGARFTPGRLIARYLERIAATSKRVKVDTVGHTFEGREMYLITVTSEANMARLAQIKGDAQRVADPRGAQPGEVDAAIKRLPAIVWLEHSVHGGEASGVEAGLGLLYQLAAGTDPETLMALDSAVVLIDPSENPDGRERHTHDVERTAGALGIASEPGALNNAGSWPGARTSHYYFDLNRDWFIQSHPESRARVSNFTQWWPQVTVDLHEQGSSATFYFAPPREPDNKNNPAHLFKWFDIFAAAHGADFDAHGWSYFRREGYDSFYPGYGEGWPMLTGSIGMLFETASSAGGAVRRNDGTLRTLHQAAWEHYTAEWATVRTSARRRTELVSDYAKARADAITTHARAPMRAVVFARDAQGRADSLAVKLKANGIDVLRLANDVTLADATPYGAGAARNASVGSAKVAAGSYVVDLAQPQGHLAKALLEPDAELDSAFVKDELALRKAGERDRFYDITAWSLPMAFRVQSWWTKNVPAGATPLGDLARPATPPTVRARYAYAFEPGSEASLRLLASLLRDSVRVWHATKSFTSAGATFEHGAFVVRVAMNRDDVHDVVQARATEAGARVVAIPSAGVDAGTDLGSNSVVPILPPKVALLGDTPVSGNAFGFAWYALEQRLGYPVTLVDADFVGTQALDHFTTLIIPSTSAGGLDQALGEGGRGRLTRWVRDGGVLITLDGATAWLAQEKVGLVRTRVVRDSVRADSSGGAPLPASLPGVLARATFDTLSPLMSGVAAGDIPVFANSDRVLSVPKDLRAGEAVIRFAPADRVRLAGYFWPEMPAKVALSPYLWTERAGRGRVIAFAQDPVYRDLFRGLLPVFGNAVLLGGTF